MNYSFKEMRDLCLDLAKEADPMEAAALRELADNYGPNPDDSQFERRIPERWVQRMETIATWWIVVVVVSFPILKIGTFILFRPEGAQHSVRAQQALAVWHWLRGLF